MLGVAFARECKRAGRGAFELTVLAVEGKSENESFVRKHLVKGGDRWCVVGVTRDNHRHVEGIACGMTEELGDNAHVGRFFLPTPFVSLERFDPDMLRFEVAEMDVDTGGGQCPHVGFVTREAFRFFTCEVLGVGGEVVDAGQNFVGSESVQVRAGEGRDVEPFHRCGRCGFQRTLDRVVEVETVEKEHRARRERVHGAGEADIKKPAGRSLRGAEAARQRVRHAFGDDAGSQRHIGQKSIMRAEGDSNPRCDRVVRAPVDEGSRAN